MLEKVIVYKRGWQAQNERSRDVKRQFT